MNSSEPDFQILEYFRETRELFFFFMRFLQQSLENPVEMRRKTPVLAGNPLGWFLASTLFLHGQGNVPFWKLSGNTSVQPGHFLGSRNPVPVRIGAGDSVILWILPGGRIGIGTDSPGGTVGIKGSLYAERLVLGGLKVSPATIPQIGIPDTLTLMNRHLIVGSKQALSGSSPDLVTFQVVGAGAFDALYVGGAFIGPTAVFNLSPVNAPPPPTDTIVYQPFPPGSEIVIATLCYDLILNPEDSGEFRIIPSAPADGRKCKRGYGDRRGVPGSRPGIFAKWKFSWNMGYVSFPGNSGNIHWDFGKVPVENSCPAP